MFWWLKRMWRKLGPASDKGSLWDGVVRSPVTAATSTDDLLRRAVLGQMKSVRAILRDRIAELRRSTGMGGRPNYHLHALGIAAEWVVTGVLDEDAAMALARTNRAEDGWSDVDWFSFLKPNELAPLRLEELKRDTKKWKRRGAAGDGNTLEVIHRQEALGRLLSAVVDSWAAPGTPPSLADAFDAYYRATFDYYDITEALYATVLEVRLDNGRVTPEKALARLQRYIWQ
jgi:hypothetical protein